MAMKHPPYRPKLPAAEGDFQEKLLTLVAECWDEVSHQRPSFSEIKRRMKGINNGKYV